jgi:methanethiol S-methyltransferase
MEPIDYTKHLILSLFVIAWCVLHSGMISASVIEYFKKHFGDRFRFYRLFFNLVAILTLIPVALFAYSIRTQAIFNWNGYLRIGQVLLLVAAVLLFFLGGRHYDVHQVFGIKQIKEGTSNKATTDSGELDTSGILGITRHPWYFDCRNLSRRKILVREFGEKYLIYQKRVPMLIPYKWLKSIIIRWHDPSNFITKQP